MDRKQEKLLVFLTENMKEMELELRAQSIVLEALAQKMIDADGLEDALQWARNSTAMREFVRVKYAGLEESLSKGERGQMAREVVDWRGLSEVNPLPN